MEVVLIGKPGTRRTEYFIKAAEQCDIPVEFIDWDEAASASLAGKAVKLDPPDFATADLFQMNGQIEKYEKMLETLSAADCCFLNPPQGICRVLNKRFAKEQMQREGVSVTPMFPEEIHTVEELHEAMERNGSYAVFIKPVRCSGAAGVLAYRTVPGMAREAVYTSCILKGDELVNTKRIRRFEKPVPVRQLLESVLSLGVVVERWCPKAVYQGKSYDLRVVWQFGSCCFAVARQSSGPITNLHLNNAPLPWKELGLPHHVTEEIERVCGQAMGCFPELNMAGIDVLLERETLRPCVIEVNGQGDLMYQDIFQENRIYKEQVLWMSKGRMGLCRNQLI